MDKVWLDRYAKRPNANFNLHETLYKTYAAVARKNPNDIAVIVDDTGEKFTHKELLELVDSISDGFHDLGIGNGSKVGIILNGFVEDVATPLALNKIGAIGKYIDFMKSVPAIKHSIDENPLDALVIDECFLPLEQAVNNRNIMTIVGNTTKVYNDGHYKTYPRKMWTGKREHINAADYVMDKPAIIISSSGTTGEPKPIVHSDYTINASAQKMLYTDFPLTRGNVVLKMIPSQVGLGLIMALYAGLISEETVVIFSCWATDNLIGKLVNLTKNFRIFTSKYGLSDKCKLNILTAPLFVRGLMRSPEVTDFSVLGCIMGAGSKMSKEELDEMSKVGKEKGLECPICNAYGQNELAGGPVTVNSNHHNVNGSAGFPTFGTDIIIVNPETHEILGNNTVGLILESSNSEFLYYDGLPEQTKNAWIILPDGKRWFNTYDLGYMDDEGFLYITGRISRVVIKEDHKISLEEVEEKIRNFPSVKDCAAIITEQGGSVENFAMFIVSESHDVIEMIATSNSLHEYEMPSKFISVKELPYLRQGKVDYQRLKQIYDSGEY